MSVQESVETENAGIDELLMGLVRFFLRNSAQGAFDLEWVMREVGKAYGVTARVLIQVEGAVMSVTHADGSQFTAVVRVSPELERLDLVSGSKRLVNQMVAGELSPRAAGQMLSDLQRSPAPYPNVAAIRWRGAVRGRVRAHRAAHLGERWVRAYCWARSWRSCSSGASASGGSGCYCPLSGRSSSVLSRSSFSMQTMHLEGRCS